MENIEILCPKCSWKPIETSRWRCSCKHSWNTFDTGGRCPACGKVWEDTQCLGPSVGGCRQWSPHLDWYKGLDEIVDALKEEIEHKWLEPFEHHH